MGAGGNNAGLIAVVAALLVQAGCTGAQPASDAGSVGDAGAPDAGGNPLPPGQSFAVANYPNGIAVTPDAIYVVAGARHEGPNSLPVAAGLRSSVQVFSHGGVLQRDIPVAAGGHSARLSPDGNRLYVAHYSLDNAVTVISTLSNTVEAVVGGAAQFSILVPDALAVSPDGQYVYVASNGPGNAGWVNRINTSTNTVDTWRVDITGGYVCWVELSEDGATLYVNSWTGGTVHRVDVATAQVTHTAAVGQFPHATLPDAQGQYVYALASGENVVKRLDALDLGAAVSLPGPHLGSWGGPVAAIRSRTGNHLFVTNYATSNVTVLDIGAQSTTRDTVVHTAAVETSPVFLALSPDGSRLYVANNAASTVTVVDTSSYR